MSENENNRIERYINQKLSADERQAFERELSENAGLREELRAQLIEQEAMGLMVKNSLSGEIKGRSQPAFDRIWEQESRRGGPGNGKRWFFAGLAFVVLVSGGAYWWWAASSAPKEAPTGGETTTEIATPPGQPFRNAPLPENSSEPEPGQKEATAPPPAVEQNESKAFAPIASLEARLGDADPEDGLEFVVLTPPQEAPFRAREGRQEILLSGQMKAILPPRKEQFFLEVIAAAQPEEPILGDKSLEFKPPASEEGPIAFAEERSFSFFNSLELPAKPGLYYFTLYTKEPRVNLFTGKFVVR